MTIREDAYGLYDKVWNSPSRGGVQEVVGRMKPSTFGYGNKIYPSPFLGLLLYDQNRVRFKEGTPAEVVGSWPERERQILFGVHDEVIRLNELCLAPLAAELLHLAAAANPYREYPRADSPAEPLHLLFSQEDAEAMARSFHTHPAFEPILSHLPKLQENPPNIDYLKVLPSFDSQLIEARPRGDVKWAEPLGRTEGPDRYEGWVLRHVAALVCLRDSLANLNQLVHQAVFAEKMTELGEDDIIKFLGSYTNSGVGFSLMYLRRSADAFMIEPTDLILVSTRTGLGPLDRQLCRVETQHDPPWDSGRPAYIELRLVDENLDAYGRLLR
ncbi:MAG: hypothetical protein M3416_02595 [Acidobacteriota bacterium]|nr:hypothetical protein [Acidobacteriota bacterium]